jgi:predicted alpha/beta superfamily hydrolase
MFGTGAGTTPASGRIVGHVRVMPDVRSPQLGNTRDIHVYLPPSYRTSGRHYPVIYMHDGQNLFDPETAFAGEWGVDETLERLGPEGIETIVVAIPNMGGARQDEYSPWSDPRAGGGRGDAYLAFIAETLKPRIDRRFRTRRDREHTGIMGSSMGGLISLYGFLQRPDFFGFCGAMSPSLWFAHRAIFEFVESRSRWFGRVYLDIGTEEGQRHVRNTQQMARLLRTRCPYPRDQVLCIVDEGAHHTEDAWSRRFETAVRFLLPRPKRDINW